MSHRDEPGRIERLQKELSARGLDGALIIHPIDLFYFSGTRQNGVLWVPVGGNPFLLVRKSLSRATVESSIPDVRPFPSSKEFPALFENVGRVGLMLDVLPVQQYNFYAKLLPGRELVDISALNRDLRSVKSPEELEKMRLSGDRLCDIFRQVPLFLQEGMREVDLSAEFEFRLRKAGSEGVTRMRAFNQEIFMGLAVAATATAPGFFDGAVTGRGLSSAAPHGASTAEIAADVPVLIDYTAVFDGYIVDMTRIFVIGSLKPELETAFSVSLAIQEEIVASLKPGMLCEDIFLKAAAMAEEAGLGRYFMGAPGENARFVGHGIGLELDEFPVLAQGFKVPLQAGQTIAVEPKFVFPGIGAIGIENTFAVSEGGGVRLTEMPDEIVYL